MRPRPSTARLLWAYGRVTPAPVMAATQLGFTLCVLYRSGRLPALDGRAGADGDQVGRINDPFVAGLSDHTRAAGVRAWPWGCLGVRAMGLAMAATVGVRRQPLQRLPTFVVIGLLFPGTVHLREPCPIRPRSELTVEPSLPHPD